jgi:hypothetical protein
MHVYLYSGHISVIFLLHLFFLFIIFRKLLSFCCLCCMWVCVRACGFVCWFFLINQHNIRNICLNDHHAMKTTIQIQKLHLYLFFIIADDNTSIHKRSHNNGPDWADHCWDHNENHVRDPFCDLLTTTSRSSFCHIWYYPSFFHSNFRLKYS